MADVCKYTQTGYFNYGTLCPMEHIQEICSSKMCRESECRKRHPLTCKYYARNNTCKRITYCAYFHPAENVSN